MLLTISKKNYKVEWLKTVIDKLTAVKTKSDIAFFSVKNLINTSQHFMYILFPIAN